MTRNTAISAATSTVSATCVSSGTAKTVQFFSCVIHATCRCVPIAGLALSRFAPSAASVPLIAAVTCSLARIASLDFANLVATFGSANLATLVIALIAKALMNATTAVIQSALHALSRIPEPKNLVPFAMAACASMGRVNLAAVRTFVPNVTTMGSIRAAALQRATNAMSANRRKRSIRARIEEIEDLGTLTRLPEVRTGCKETDTDDTSRLVGHTNSCSAAKRKHSM